MRLSNEQISKLLNLITSGEPDSLDCDGCFEQLSEFAEHQLADRDIPQALQAVEVHLKQCACCQGEFQALLDALRALDE